MKCANCLNNALKSGKSLDETETIFLRQNIGTRPAPLIQRRVLICEKCGKRVFTLETISNTPNVFIESKKYNKLKHIMSIVEALGSARQEAYNIALKISDKFLSNCYQEKYDKKSSYDIKKNRLTVSKKDLIDFTYKELNLQKFGEKDLKWGVEPNCEIRYLAEHDLDSLLKKYKITGGK